MGHNFDKIEIWLADVRSELLDDILPFWRRYSVDEPNGGFIAEMSKFTRKFSWER